MPQTTITRRPGIGREGLLYDAQEGRYDAVSGIVDESIGIEPGLLVLRGDTDFGAVLPDAADSVTALGSNVLGVAMLSHKTLVSPSSDDNEVYEDESTIPLLRHGRIWVRFEDAVTPTSSVFVRLVASGSEKLGAFRTDADGTDAVAWTAAKVLTSASAGGLAVIEVNI